MAAAPEKQSPEVQALIQRLEASRSGLGVHLADLKHKLDVPARVKGAVSGKPWLWFGGSLGLGFVASQMLRRTKKKPKKKSRWLGLMFTAGLALAKPVLKQWISRELQRRLLPPDDSNRSGLPLSKP